MAVVIVMAVRKTNVRQDRQLHELQSSLDFVRGSLDTIGASSAQDFSNLRQEVTGLITNMSSSTAIAMSSSTANTEKSLEMVRETINRRLESIRQDNEIKLGSIQQTVDKKLGETLKGGLDTSFASLNSQLDQVSKSMGEMRNLASGIVDLKTILGNIKNRGTWGEVQLGRLIEDMLAPSQYRKELQITGSERVDYAVCFPGADGEPVYLPIDSKFPLDRFAAVQNHTSDSEEYRRDVELLAKAVKDQAASIRKKYISPPMTTDFAVMFVPSEGLYSFLCSQNVLSNLQLEHRILLAGPATLAALLNSLLVGFKTIAIEAKSAELLKQLAAVKKSLGTFSENLESIGRGLKTASNSLERANANTRTIARQLRDIEEIEEGEARQLLGEGFFETEE